MQYRECGTSGLTMSALTLGLMVRDCAPGEAFESVRRTVLRAVDHGITAIDLATGYGGGAVEQAVGAILRSDLAAHRDRLVLATKGGWGDGTRAGLTASIDRSLSQLGVECVDVYYHHAPDPNTPPEETAAVLASFVQAGKARFVGISNYSLAETIRIAGALQRLGTPALLHQCNYNLLNRWVEDGLLAALPALGMCAAVFSVLNQGVLSDATLAGPAPGSRAEKSLAALIDGIGTGEPAYGRYAAGDAAPQVLQLLSELSIIARERGQTLAQLALTWVLRHASVATALVGLSSPAQVDAAVAALDAPELTAEERRRIARLLPPRWGML